MLTVEEARERVLAQVAPLAAEDVPLAEALGRVAAAAIESREELPPFANSAMDGYALRSDDTRDASPDAPVALRLVGEVPAGRVFVGAVSMGEAVRILTGAAVPEGADAVLQQELTQVNGSAVVIQTVVTPGNNIRPAGEDVRRGETVVRQGTVLGPAEIALLAAVGVDPVRVTRQPRVAILATGDELAAPSEPLQPGQIHESNTPYLAAAVERAGGVPIRLGVARDRIEELREMLARAREADLIITSGGVSVGDYDLVKQVLGEQGAIDFWRVRMRPGKPLAFGMLGQTPLLGLPGNPVSAAVTFELFARPAIRRMLGCVRLDRPVVRAMLTGADIPRGDRRHYVRVRLWTDEHGILMAEPTGAQGSNIISSLQGASALAVIEEGEGAVRAGELVPALLLNDAMPWGE